MSEKDSVVVDATASSAAGVSSIVFVFLLFLSARATRNDAMRSLHALESIVVHSAVFYLSFADLGGKKKKKGRG